MIQKASNCLKILIFVTDFYNVYSLQQQGGNLSKG